LGELDTPQPSIAGSWPATTDLVNLLSMLDAYGDSAVLFKLNISQIAVS